MGQSHQVPFERRAGLYSLAVAACAAVVIWLAWWMWQETPPQPAKQRGLSDIETTWKCDNGHVFEAPADYGSIPCPECQADAYILGRYRCSEHGDLEAQLSYERTADGKGVLAKMRFTGGEWIDHPKELRCPQCNRRLTPVRLDAFWTGPKSATQRGG